jgi:polyvinyl alcohol dehydrogenase (cytochrome)
LTLASRQQIARGGAALAAAVATGLAFAAQAPAATRCTDPTPRGGDWPAYGHDRANTRSQPEERRLTRDVVRQLEPAWVFSTATGGDGSQLQSTPIVVGGCVYVGSAKGVAYAIDAATGARVWDTDLHVQRPPTDSGGALVGAPAVTGGAVIFLVSELEGGPYAVALDRSDGSVLWRSAPVVSGRDEFTNASGVVAGGVLFMGYSPRAGDTNGQGGFALIDASSGAILKVTPTIPPADQAQGYAGGGIWSTPAFDPRTDHVYVGSGNPFNRSVEHPNTNSILKVDVRRGRSTFGQIVDRYKGNVDQYEEELQLLAETPICKASEPIPFFFGDPFCFQFDLDFGASPNLFRDSRGRLLVGELQKAGVFHTVTAQTMDRAWTALVGLPCFPCNAASTAFDGRSVIGVFTPGGVATSLARDDGSVNWRQPIGDGVHYQATSTAARVAYTLDSNGFFHAFDATTGEPLVRRPMAADTGTSMTQHLLSTGVAIAGHTVFVAATASNNTGYVIAYRRGSG